MRRPLFCGSIQVGLDESTNLGIREFEQRLAVARADIVDQHVESTVLCRDRRKGGVQRGGIGDVEGRGLDAAATRLADARSRRGEAGRIAAVDDDVTAGAGERLGDLEAEATPGSGHQDDLAGQGEALQRRQHGARMVWPAAFGNRAALARSPGLRRRLWCRDEETISLAADFILPAA
jgi:hypothetical protein